MRSCKGCDDEIPAERRSDAEFCDDDCKRDYHRNRAEAGKPFWNGLAGITRRRPRIREV